MKKYVREPVNFITHAIPAVLALPASVLMIQKSANGEVLLASIIYGLCFFLLFLASALYHSIPRNEMQVRFWQKVDHASIYLMIAGSYTPTALLIFDGWIKWTILCVVWGIALFGVISKLSGKLRNDKLSLFLYLAMGWIVVIFIYELYKALPIEALAWLIGGGLLYSVGSIFYKLDRPIIKDHFGYHEIWHVFVFAGAAAHFIYNYCYIIAI